MKRLPWLRLPTKSGREVPFEPPIWLGNHSNGEYFHEATPRERQIRKLILQGADEGARRHGIDRREFLASAAGMATSLATINTLAACSADDGKMMGTGPTGAGTDTPPPGLSGTGGAAGTAGISGSAGAAGTVTGPAGAGGLAGQGGGAGQGGASGMAASGGTSGEPMQPPSGGTGGFFDVGDPMDPQCAEGRMLDPESTFVFDLQTHYLERIGNPSYQSFFFPAFAQAGCGGGLTTCFGRDEYIDLMFIQSDTTLAMLSAVPAVDAENPLTNEEIAAGRDLINMLGGDSQRMVIQGQVLPNDGPLQPHLDGMQRLVEELGVICWKVHTEWGPRNVAFNAPDGFWLDDYQASGAAAVGIPFIEKARSLGVKSFCCHKGLPAPQFNSEHTSPRDIGPVAAMFPDCNWIVYHSAYGFGGALGGGEGAYQAGSMSGIDSMITVMRDSGIAKNANVYAELAGVWAGVMTDPTTAAHVIGKLLLHVGEDNVLWGTDCIWQSKPQPYVDSFWLFQISQEFQDRYGYPALTDDIKRKILGLNAARVFGIDVAQRRCLIDRTELAQVKRVLDGELGSRRWSPPQPLGPTTRREFVQLQRLRSFLRVPG